MNRSPSASGSPISSLAKAPTSKEDLLGLSNDVFEHAKKGRHAFEYRIKEAMHFLAGDQWIQYLPHTNTFARQKLDDWVPTPITNLLIEHFDYIVDLFTAGDPGPSVRPATRNQDDIDRAQAAERALRSEFERLKSADKLLGPAAGWLTLTGNCVLSSVWNGTKGDKIRLPKMKVMKEAVTYEVGECPECGYTEQIAIAPERCPTCAERGQDVPMRTGTKVETDPMTGQTTYDTWEEQEEKDGAPVYDELVVGQLEEHCLNLLNWFPQPCRDPDDMRWDIETDPMNIDRIKDLFGTKAKDVVSEHIRAERSGASPFLSILSDTASYMRDQQADTDNALVKIFRHIPDHRFPKGKLVISTRDTLLYSGDLDASDGNLPRTLIRYRQVPGQFWGMGPIIDAISGQKRLNAIDSNIVQNRKQMVNPQWLVPEGAGMSRVSGASGVVNRWSPHASGGFKPERLRGESLPNQVFQERTETQQGMRAATGLHEAMQGSLPTGSSGLETGAAVEFLFERAYKRFGQPMRNWRAGLATHFHRNLLHLNDNWDEQRLVRVLGENSELESYYYQGSDFQGAEDMVIHTGVGMKGSDVAYQQRIMKVAELGFLGDTRRPEVRGKILEHLQIEGFDHEYLLDAKKARRVLQALKDGKEPNPILPAIDNHAIAFSILREFMLKSDFYALDEQRQQAIIERGMQHQQIMQQEQQRVMQAAQASKGAPEQSGQAIEASGAMGPQGIPTMAQGA
jgi:hypothetical protein